MAKPAFLPYHNHVSEQQPGADEDCLWMSGVEFLREAYDHNIPATHAEGDALRKASGDTGFSNMTNFRAGVAKRYPKIELNPSRVGISDILSHFKLGGTRVGMVSGKLTNMSSHYRRWYPSFTGGHTVFVAYDEATKTFWWCDPGAPETKADGTKYLGEPITEAQLKLFIGTYGYPAILRNALAAPVVVPPVAPVPPATAIYTQAQLDAAVAAARADQKTSDAAVCNARVTTAIATADAAGYNGGVKAAQAAVNAIPLK